MSGFIRVVVPPCPSCGIRIASISNSACPICKTVLRPIQDPKTGRIIRWVLANRFRT